MALADLRPHFRPTILLAYPVVLSQLGHVMVTVVDSKVVGHLGTVPLAAVGLSVSMVTLLMVFGLGLSMGITPLVAADRQRDVSAIGRLLTNGVLLCTAGGVGLAAVGWLLLPLLRYLHQDAAVLALAIPWIRVLLLSLVPLMVFQGFRQFAEGLGLTRQAMQLSILANVVNAALCYALVFGRWGAPALGMMGAAWATLLARTLMAALMAAYVLRSERLRPYRAGIRSWQPHLPTLRRLTTISLPIGAQMMFEVGAFSVSNIMTGWIGASTQAAHQISIVVASVTYMAASGIATAATIRVSQYFGLGDVAGARRAGFAAYLLTLLFMGSMGLLLVFGRHLIPQFFDAAPAVAAQAATLLLVAALFQVSDGLQVVGLGALRGLEDVRVPSIVALLAYWALALPLSYALGFGLSWGAPGVWLGLLVGLSAVAAVLLRRFQRETSGPGRLAREMNETAALRG